MKFSELSLSINFNLAYSGFLVGSKVDSLHIYRKNINSEFYIAASCTERKGTVTGVTLYLNKIGCVSDYYDFESFADPDFLYFSENDVVQFSVIERSGPIFKDLRSDLNVENLKSLKVIDFNEWLCESINYLVDKVDDYANIISLGDLSAIEKYNFNRVFLVRSLIENTLSSSFIDKILSLNSKYSIVSDVKKIIHDVESFKKNRVYRSHTTTT